MVLTKESLEVCLAHFTSLLHDHGLGQIKVKSPTLGAMGRWGGTDTPSVRVGFCATLRNVASKSFFPGVAATGWGLIALISNNIITTWFHPPLIGPVHAFLKIEVDQNRLFKSPLNALLRWSPCTESLRCILNQHDELWWFPPHLSSRINMGLIQRSFALWQCTNYFAIVCSIRMKPTSPFKIKMELFSVNLMGSYSNY